MRTLIIILIFSTSGIIFLSESAGFARTQEHRRCIEALQSVDRITFGIQANFPVDQDALLGAAQMMVADSRRLLSEGGIGLEYQSEIADDQVSGELVVELIYSRLPQDIVEPSLPEDYMAVWPRIYSRHNNQTVELPPLYGVRFISLHNNNFDKVFLAASAKDLLENISCDVLSYSADLKCSKRSDWNNVTLTHIEACSSSRNSVDEIMDFINTNAE